MRTNLAILFSLFSAVALHALPALGAEAESQALTYFLYEQEYARRYVDRCSTVLPSPLQEDIRVTYASYLLQLAQAQRILENQGVKPRAVDHTPPSTKLQQAKDAAIDHVETAMRTDPVRACRVYFQMMRSQTDAAAIAMRKAKSIERLDDLDRSLKQSPPVPAR